MSVQYMTGTPLPKHTESDIGSRNLFSLWIFVRKVPYKYGQNTLQPMFVRKYQLIYGQNTTKGCASLQAELAHPLMEGPEGISAGHCAESIGLHS